MEEADFLGRIYDLTALPSEDPRFPNAAGDIWQHRVRNYDWPDDWVFTDSRFELMHGPDTVLLRFVAEMLHPVVRSDEEEVAQLASTFNEALRRDGYELYVAEWISGHGVYGWRRMDSFHGSTPDLGLASRPLTDRLARTGTTPPCVGRRRHSPKESRPWLSGFGTATIGPRVASVSACRNPDSNWR